MTNRILIKDKDIRMSMFFLTNLTTILEFMQLNMVKNQDDGGIDLEYYKKKMLDYEMVFDAVIDEFKDEMFGIYSNSATRDVFQSNLTKEGWKYFDFQNLNEFFAIKYSTLVAKGKMDEQKLMQT